MEKLTAKLFLKETSQITQLTSLSGMWVYLALTASLLSFLILSVNMYSLVLSTVFGIRLILTRQRLVITSCLFLFLSFGCFFFYVHNQTVKGLQLKNEVVSNCLILVQPDTVEVDGQSLKFRAVITESGEKIKVNNWLRTKEEHDYFLNLDDRVCLKVSGELTSISVKRNLGAFDYKKYATEQGVYRQLKVDEILSKSKDKSFSPIGIIRSCRAKINRYITKNYPTTTASYLKSLFIGVKDHEFKANQNQLSRLGILHFFSISGMHVYFFLALLAYGLRRIGLFPEGIYGLEISFLLLFLGLTGFSTSVGRSVFYIAILKSVQRFRLTLSPLDAWSLALLFSLVINPYLLLTAAGQLSFGLTAYIIFLAPIIQKQVSQRMELLVFSVVLSILSVPIVAFNFFEWQIGSLLLTVILMPFFSFVLMPSLLGLLIINLVMPIGSVLNEFDAILSKGQEVLFKLNNLDSFHIVTGKLPLIVVGVAIVISIIWLSKVRPSFWFSVICLVGMVAVISGFKYCDPRGMVAFVDVGQGDGLVIKRPFNRGTIIVDTGGKLEVKNPAIEGWKKGSGKSSEVNYDIIPVLKSLGVASIDAVFITHGHIDHFGNLPMVAQQFKIKKLIYPEGTKNQSLFNELSKTLKNKKIPQVEVLAGTKWNFSEYQLTSLAPLVAGKGDNDNSLVLKTKIKDKSFLLMGDLEKPGEEMLVRRYADLKTDILSTGHHGSKTSSNDFFINRVRPTDAIISCGVANHFGHPNQETLENLAKVNARVFRTDQQGMIYYTWTPFSSKLSQAKTVMLPE